MYIKEQTPSIHGVFHLDVKDNKGNLVDTATEYNVIVNSARLALTKLLSGADTSNTFIRYFAVGVSTTPASPTDTSLGQQVYKNNIVSYDFPVNGQVRFHWHLDYNEANGHDITEFGLICNDGTTLFSHRVRSTAVTKTNDLSFDGTWTIIF